MGKHIPAYDNKNTPIIDVDDDTTPCVYFNSVILKRGETHRYQLSHYESAIVLAGGTCNITVNQKRYEHVGIRENVWSGDPSAVYAPVGADVFITCVSDEADIMIAGGRYETALESFEIRPEDTDHVQYGSDETKTHRKIKHILGKKCPTAWPSFSQ
jgi:5-deoxyglucuronate isomerase (EC 5.3.1.-)